MTSEEAKRANQSRWTVLDHNPDRKANFHKEIFTSARGVTPETWLCVDCGMDTAPGATGRKQTEIDIVIHGHTQSSFGSDTEVYTLQEEIWAKTGMEPMGGCLCIGCVEKRIGRRLKPKDFLPDHPFNDLPGTPRLLKRRGRR
jgi:hypothetical protein